MEDLKLNLVKFGLDVYIINNRYFLISYDECGIKFDAYFLFGLGTTQLLSYIRARFKSYGITVRFEVGGKTCIVDKTIHKPFIVSSKKNSNIKSSIYVDKPKQFDVNITTISEKKKRIREKLVNY